MKVATRAEVQKLAKELVADELQEMREVLKQHMVDVDKAVKQAQDIQFENLKAEHRERVFKFLDEANKVNAQQLEVLKEHAKQEHNVRILAIDNIKADIARIIANSKQEVQEEGKAAVRKVVDDSKSMLQTVLDDINKALDKSRSNAEKFQEYDKRLTALSDLYRKLQKDKFSFTIGKE